MKNIYLFFFLLITFVKVSAQSWDEGVAAFRANDYQRASGIFLDLSEQYPEAWNINFMAGKSLLLLGNKDDSALHYFRKAYDLNPNDKETQVELALIYFKTTRYDEGESILAQIIYSDLDKKDLERIRHTLRSIPLDAFNETKWYILRRKYDF